MAAFAVVSMVYLVQQDISSVHDVQHNHKSILKMFTVWLQKRTGKIALMAHKDVKCFWAQFRNIIRRCCARDRVRHWPILSNPWYESYASSLCLVNAPLDLSVPLRDTLIRVMTGINATKSTLPDSQWIESLHNHHCAALSGKGAVSDKTRRWIKL